MRLNVIRDATAVIRHIEFEVIAVLDRRQLDSAVGGDIADGVTKQMFEALAQPARIDANEAGFDDAFIVEVNPARLEAFGQAGAGLGDDVEQADVSQRHRHLAGIDLRHVEHVVD